MPSRAPPGSAPPLLRVSLLLPRRSEQSRAVALRRRAMRCTAIPSRCVASQGRSDSLRCLDLPFLGDPAHLFAVAWQSRAFLCPHLALPGFASPCHALAPLRQASPRRCPASPSAALPCLAMPLLCFASPSFAVAVRGCAAHCHASALLRSDQPRRCFALPRRSLARPVGSLDAPPHLCGETPGTAKPLPVPARLRRAFAAKRVSGQIKAVAHLGQALPYKASADHCLTPP